ncbi:MAG: CBS domain-containing protein [Saprospiraceae bacterium]|nr:CBS domain-containing protein [Saprospiraceae bacterium]
MSVIEITGSVSLIMTKQPLCVTKNHTLDDVRNLMEQKNIRHIPVIDDGKLVGILSKTDLEKLSLLDKSVSQSMSTEHFMTKGVHALQQDDSIKDAAELLSLGSYHALPVLDGEMVVGIVTSTDLIDFLLNHHKYLFRNYSLPSID